MVCGSGFCTSKGELVRSILYPKEIMFKFYKDAVKFVGVLACLATIGMIYSATMLILKHVRILATSLFGVLERLEYLAGTIKTSHHPSSLFLQTNNYPLPFIQSLMLFQHKSSHICIESYAIYTPRTTHNRFTALWILSRTTRVSRYQKTFTHSHSSWSSIIPICFLHLL